MIWMGLFLGIQKWALGEVIKYLSQYLNETQTLSYLALIVDLISSACLNKKHSYYISKINNCTTAKYTSVWSFVTARISYQQSKSLHLEIDLRWLTTVFLRLTSARYDSPPHISICRVCKNDASNLKKYQKNTPALERRQISLVYVAIVSKFAQACI